jgi:Flp pilus assembly protein TadG
VKRPVRRDRAQALIEFAIVVPVFLLLMLALIDFGRLLFTYISLANGAREMARIAAVSNNWSGTAAINAFNNYTLIAAGQNPSSDAVTVRYGSQSCARTLDLGGTCSPTKTFTCTMPLSSGSCSPAFTATPPQKGYVEVQVSYTFQFNPMFQNRIEGVIDVSFIRPTAQVTTTARAYVE